MRQAMHKKGNGLFRSIWSSATSFDFYRSVMAQPLGVSIRYFVLLSFIVAACVGARYHFTLARDVEDFAVWAARSIPVVAIHDGAVKVAVPQPFVLEDGTSAIVIDTTVAQPSLDPKYAMGLLLGKETLQLRMNALKQKEYRLNNIDLFILGAAFSATLVKSDVIDRGVLELSKVKQFVIDGARIEKWKKTFVAVGSVVFPVLYLLYFMLSKLIQAAFFGFVIFFSNKTLKEAGIAYEKVFNVCVYALTPVAMLMVAVTVLGLDLPYSDILYLFTYVAFLLGAITSCMPRPRRVHEDRTKDDWNFFE
ncbi:MAG TPA: DUF1189 family protein [bacterium]|nr:DUF1189 family protein [bacterium]